MSLSTASRSLFRDANRRFPGAEPDALNKFVLLQVSTALEHPGRNVKDEFLSARIDEAFNEAVGAGEEWALALANSYRDGTVKPLVDEARAKGLDPLPIVLFKTDLSEDVARSMIESLDGDPTGTDEDDSAPAPGGFSPDDSLTAA